MRRLKSGKRVASAHFKLPVGEVEAATERKRARLPDESQEMAGSSPVEPPPPAKRLSPACPPPGRQASEEGEEVPTSTSLQVVVTGSSSGGDKGEGRSTGGSGGASSGGASSAGAAHGRLVKRVPADFPWTNLVKIGQGTYGEVYKARPGPSRAARQCSLVALKRLRIHDDSGFPLTSVRERKILLALQHPNLVRLYEMYQPSPTSEDVYMVFEFLELDLEIIIQSPAVRRIEPPRVKSFMQQLLDGTDFMHRRFSVMHRDLKPSNLLVSRRGDLKICDFGLARAYRPGRSYTMNVVTLNYRAPELLLSCHRYGPPIDLWSCGCIFAELLERKIAIPGRHEGEYLDNLWVLCGAPTPDMWPDAAKLCPSWLEVAASLEARKLGRSVFSRFASADPGAAPLVDKMLRLSPTQRISAEKALDDDYFWSGVPALPKENRALEWDIEMVRAARDDQRRSRHHR